MRVLQALFLSVASLISAGVFLMTPSMSESPIAVAIINQSNTDKLLGDSCDCERRTASATPEHDAKNGEEDSSSSTCSWDTLALGSGQRVVAFSLFDMAGEDVFQRDYFSGIEWVIRSWSETRIESTPRPLRRLVLKIHRQRLNKLSV